MIIGAKYWDRDYYSQDNNPTETLLKKLLGKLKGWRETCGPTAAVNCLAALGYDLEYKGPGDYDPQPEEILSDFMNEGRGKYKKMLENVRKGVSGIPGGRIPQFYPVAVKEVFGAEGKFSWLHNWNYFIDYIKTGKKTIQLCFKKPGHYFGIVAYDEDKNEFIIKDSWPTNPRNRNKGNMERLTREEFDTNTFDYCVIYSI